MATGPRFDAVLGDLRLTSPDLILNGGDLPYGGSIPAETVDCIRDLEALGEARLAWLSGLPRTVENGSVALVHASPESTWHSPAHTADDEELASVYAPLGHSIAIYGHIHVPFIRTVSSMTVLNSGSVSLSYDGDRRAAYLLLDDATPTIRRVEYDVDRELKALSTCRLPHADWIARIIESASPQMP
jgi:hypothetical protein